MTTAIPTLSPTLSPTLAPTLSPTLFNGTFISPTSSPTSERIEIFLPIGIGRLNIFLMTMLVYLVAFQLISLGSIFWWWMYPLPSDERVSFPNLLASIWSVFILVGDYSSDVLVALAIFFGEISTLSADLTFDAELFTQLVVALSSISLFAAVIAMTWTGKRYGELSFWYLPFKFLLVLSGLYPFKLLVELVTANYYGGIRAKLSDIVWLKYIQGTVEGVPQIALLIYLNLLNVNGLGELVGISLAFSVVSLVSGLVMWDYVRETEQDEYSQRHGVNDVNYLFFSPYLSVAQLDVEENGAKSKYKLIDWAFHSIVTRVLECIGRLAYYSTFAIVSNGWGVALVIVVDIILILRYHRFVFFFHSWLELIFNLRDEGNFYIAAGEWKWKLATTIIGYIIIAARLSNDPSLININSNGEPEQLIFYLGLASNILLYPWIFYMFRRQRKFEKVIENDDVEDALEDVKQEGIRVFDEEAQGTWLSSLNPLYYFK